MRPTLRPSLAPVASRAALTAESALASMLLRLGRNE